MFLDCTTVNCKAVNRAMSQRGMRNREVGLRLMTRLGVVELPESKFEAVGTT